MIPILLSYALVYLIIFQPKIHLVRKVVIFIFSLPFGPNILSWFIIIPGCLNFLICFKKFKACFYIGTCRFFKMQPWSPREHHLRAKGLNNCGLFPYPCQKHEHFKELYITEKKPHLMWLKDVEVRKLTFRFMSPGFGLIQTATGISGENRKHSFVPPLSPVFAFRKPFFPFSSEQMKACLQVSNWNLFFKRSLLE